MRDAIGGTFSITAIVIFLIIVNCFLAFSVNYTKAFRAKNEVRSIIEKYEGLSCDALHSASDVLAKNKYRIMDESVTWCETHGWEVARYGGTPLFCYKIQKADIAGGQASNKLYKGAYYTVLTFVNLDIPIFRKLYIGAAGVFQVKGETALIYSSGNNIEVSNGCGA